MSELRDILAAYARLRAEGGTAVLASLVHAAGSTYRRPGARMWIADDDTLVGLLGGGCLEGDLLERAARVRASGAPQLVRYDATAEEDIVWGLGLGCAGIVEVWLERVEPESPGPLDFLADCARRRVRGALATAFSGPRAGRRVAWEEGGAAYALGVPDPVPDAVRAALGRALREARAGELEAAGARWCVEPVGPPLRLAVFGGGPDAAPLVALAVRLGWDVTVVDARPAYARPERLPGARVLCVPFEDAVAAAELGRDTFAVVMTHHYLHDRTLLAGLLASPARYLGLLGPKRRSEDLLRDLAAEGIAAGEEDRGRIFGPAGLDLGAEAPEEIALALTAEIQALAAGRSGGFLRERKGPIHDPVP